MPKRRRGVPGLLNRLRAQARHVWLRLLALPRRLARPLGRTPRRLAVSGSELTLGSRVVRTAWPILEAYDDGQRVIVLLDPDAYVSDPGYKLRERRGERSIPNLIAYSPAGDLLWEAEFPSDAPDYYYAIHPGRRLTARCFRSFTCDLDPATGRIVRKEFVK